MSVSGNSAYVKSMPLDWNWSDQYYNSDVSFPDPPYISNTEYAAKQGYLENWYTLSGNILHVKSQYTYIDSFDHSGISVDPSILTDTTNPDYIGPYNSSVTFAGGFQAGCWGVWDQNTSIVTTPDFSTMYTYGGNSPWTGGTLSSVLLSSDNQVQNNGAENWIALVNQTNGKGVGIYSPQNAVANALDIAGGHMCLGGVGGSTVNGGIWGTTANIGLGWNFTPAGSAQTSVSGPVMTVDSYYTIGTISDIRSAIYSIHAGLSQSPGVQAQVAQSARIRMK